MSLGADLVGTMIGSYRVLQQVGVGSFAHVYRGTHTLLEREVAIKVLKPVLATDQSFLERFRREAVAIAKIEHPNVVGVFDFGLAADGFAYLVMEWVSGRTLARAIAEAQRFPIDRIGRLLRQVASGLGAAHRLGLVHRDVKPANIILTEAGGAEAAKLVDFGIVRAGSDIERLTRAGEVLGTPQYMDPEVIVGREPTPQSDLYALGVIAFQLIAGRLPFDGRTASEILRKHVLVDELPPIPVAAGLDVVVKWLLEKDPHRRPESAAVLIDALDALGLEGQFSPDMLRTEGEEAIETDVSATAMRPSSAAGDQPDPATTEPYPNKLPR